MYPLLPALLGLSVAASPAQTVRVNPAVIEGLEIAVERNRVTVRPGICRATVDEPSAPARR
ncbi:MAG: hypothetical protein IT210_04810 [Armatimonadetes bacterium]|nr:hypothetical protein [Armatimonadota bacterium]